MATLIIFSLIAICSFNELEIGIANESVPFNSSVIFVLIVRSKVQKFDQNAVRYENILFPFLVICFVCPCRLYSHLTRRTTCSNLQMSSIRMSPL